MRFLLGGCGEKTTLRGYDDNRGEILFETAFENCSYLCKSDNAIFTISELSPRSKLHILSLDGKPLHSYELDGAGLCHIAYLKHYSILTGAFYNSGTVFWAKVDSRNTGDSRIVGDFHYQNQGESPGKAHCTVPNADESLLFSANIAQDRVYLYLPSENGLEETGFLQLPSGVGARHILPFERNSYFIITEYSNEILTVRNGVLVAQASTLAENFTGTSYGSALCMTDENASGLRFLYVGNRGENTIAVFAVDSKFTLTPIGRFDCGDFPRHIALVGNSSYVASANQHGGDFRFFKIDISATTVAAGMPQGEPIVIPFDTPEFICDW